MVKLSGSSGVKKNKILLYAVDVFLFSGPVTSAFAKKNPVVARTIQIRGDQTLECFHQAIFEAFDREEEHMYQFQFGKRPNDNEGARYVLPLEAESPFGENDAAGFVTETTIDSLDLNIDQSFGYWFDFGDDWWHQINVVSIENTVPSGKYPRVIKRIGNSPPQYPDAEE